MTELLRGESNASAAPAMRLPKSAGEPASAAPLQAGE
jgi:hypothetical protein